jgi:hypothetical protein
VACPMKLLERQVAHHAATLMHQHLRTSKPEHVIKVSKKNTNYCVSNPP